MPDRRVLGVSLAILLVAHVLSAAEPNLVVNGSFEACRNVSGPPDGWSASGSASVKQQLTRDVGREGGSSARLQCTEFAGDDPAAHAMLCQVGKVSVGQGRWYRLTFWAKAEGIQAGTVDVALSNTRSWTGVGLNEVFTPERQWRRFEFVFRAKADLPAAASRLQFWFKGTGTLWLADVAIVPTQDGVQWFPQIPTEGVKNFLPNSSFECGPAGWGSMTYGLKGWAGNLYRLEGELDAKNASHGRRALKIALSSKDLPLFWFDYYEPVRQPVRRVLAANHGWFKVTPGERLTLSAFLKADADDVPAEMVIQESDDRMQRKPLTVGREWRRQEFSFAPRDPFMFIAVGLNLEGSKMESATLWIDAVQLERGAKATDYRPRRPVESYIETAVPGNLFIEPSQGLSFALRAYNDTAAETTLEGDFQLTDFFDRTVEGSGQKRLTVSPHADATSLWKGSCLGKTGYYRASWTTPAGSQSLRCATIEPADRSLRDSPLGFNHAYPWDFLTEEARLAGVVWWRDWSAKWQSVEPERGRFDFSVADAQIRRVLNLQSEVEVLLPFPSALWSTTARPAEVEKAAGSNSYLRTRLPVAYPPKDLSDFGRYAAEVAKHYGQEPTRPVTHVQILNEPIYTDYALPRKFGCKLDDYLRLLAVAHRAIKEARPECRVVGGISAGLDAGLTREFITQGGLASLDVIDLHMYDPPRPAERFEASFASLEKLMAEHGGPKPVWITEWGCYADDDPACVPQSVGDETMNRCRWSSESAATEHVVKFTAVSFAHGVRKIFFHAGTCGRINGPDAGGVLFEYGGTPRKMFCGVAVLNRLLGVPEACVHRVSDGETRAYVFRTGGRFVAIAWSSVEPRKFVGMPEGVRMIDIMGNPVAGEPSLGPSPCYLVASDVQSILQTLGQKP